MDNCPSIIEETDDFAVVFKPPKMHSAPLKKKDGGTLFEWYSSQSPHVFDLMHRLDFETHGLVLFAKNQKSFDFFKNLQETGGFIKEYSAVCASSVPADSIYTEGYPPPPVFPDFSPSSESPVIIGSYFRPYGHGRKLVRPVTEFKKKREIAADRGGFYRTEITGINENIFTLRIKRGFRHQIRCHLCWIGFPILNDPLYAPSLSNNQFLTLRAHALFFTDPSNKSKREYRIAALEKTPF
jgi:23S rRNA pseudouridine1911/1915/1917 synthase